MSDKIDLDRCIVVSCDDDTWSWASNIDHLIVLNDSGTKALEAGGDYDDLPDCDRGDTVSFKRLIDCWNNYHARVGRAGVTKRC
jgi:hypothetical protein